MTDARSDAERLLRRFASDTNLLIAGRPMRVAGEGPVAEALTGMLAAMGARVDVTDAPAHAERDLTRDTVVFDIDTGAITMGGEPTGGRGDAAGRLDFAAAHMPVSTAIAAELAQQGTVRGLSVGVSMTLEPKTANLALLLAQAGATVAVYAHPDETDTAVAQALRDRGVPVDASAEVTPAQELEAALQFIDRGFDVLVDDGSHITRLSHEHRPHQVSRWIGATEETTSGLAPLRHMQDAGVLATGVIAVNDAITKTGFDNRYGTGQSCVLAIADLLADAGVSVRDQPALVIGYGPVGVGVAAHLRALGVDVSVSEIDPARALLALHDGFRVDTADALAEGALVVSATGWPATVSADLTDAAAAVAVAGGVPGEIAWHGALTPVAPHVERTATGTLIVDRGGCINVTAAEGNPIEIMDLSFATQLAAIAEVVQTRPTVGVHPLSDSAVTHVAATAAHVRGIALEPGATRASAGSTDWRSPRYTVGRPPFPSPDGS
ncbi:adenosylhomocysteinase [Demequina sp. B12]|uniref:adenosylhomocysteinase n=1 Tax=Demequina sp. B12 TaxID=2992757 RepID=UPI00237BA59F|nr:adenosylhomocysteinase [Demequina sp. B12]MDE0573776.1 adenosylhomocysteinase [Demequina sp. B12]